MSDDGKSDTTPAELPIPGILRLPTELRLRIYGRLFLVPKYDLSKKSTDATGKRQVFLPVMRTCSVFRNEAANLYHKYLVAILAQTHMKRRVLEHYLMHESDESQGMLDGNKRPKVPAPRDLGPTDIAAALATHDDYPDYIPKVRELAIEYMLTLWMRDRVKDLLKAF
ncbi:hypothetical protein BAUCODRAFT_23556 [Baudoinia panamericana UAMH 10762]|uniref:Uncharacterized protein n=1 Tax=Baudoinia panamericana (strain UAMH 10762) TaxID=717646 RepID=M2NE31_BAUPA|nr:uncharacterized protein BAUCODRAFT_23556 [Baudoinia panamericana UAMH 10762]EMC97195.1 hypothetical protein BAUCODRAFT_23556 [Baudoinia panamericana UAMH 10762]